MIPDGEGPDEVSDADAGWSGEPVIPPPVPDHLGQALELGLRDKLHQLIYANPGQLGSVYRAMVKLPGAKLTELLPLTTCANTGVVGNRRVIVFAIMDEVEPTASSVARQAASTVRTLVKSVLDDEMKTHLGKVLQVLEEKASSQDAVEEEGKQLEADSSELAQSLKEASGVYVYTYPHYWRHPFIPGTERRLLKIGRTANKAWARVLSQARLTGMPEDPLLLRVYCAADPADVERSFHMLLDAAEHERSVGTAVGSEWFSTTIEYCDTIATVLGLTVVKGSSGQAD